MLSSVKLLSSNARCKNPRCNVIAPASFSPRSLDKARELVVGIDLGTTNSAVAYIDKGKPKCIPNGDGQRTTPSVVAFTEDGDVVVGSKARQHAAKNPGCTFYSVKRIIGRQFNDPMVQEELPHLSYKASATCHVLHVMGAIHVSMHAASACVGERSELAPFVMLCGNLL